MTHLFHSAASPPLSNSAATRVFGLLELVEVIIKDFSQAELLAVLTLTRAYHAEADRLLYQSPVLDVVQRNVSDRLTSLTLALSARPDRAKTLTIRHDQTTAPKKRLLDNLFKECSTLTGLVLVGVPPPALANIRAAVSPIACQLTTLSVSLHSRTSFYNVDATPLLSACIGLCHLELNNFGLDGRSPPSPAPTYQLTRLTIKQPKYSLEQDDLSWVIGGSRNSLRLIEISDASFGRLVRGDGEFARCVPPVEEARFHPSEGVMLGNRLTEVLKVADYNAVKRAAVHLGLKPSGLSWEGWDSADDVVNDALQALDARSRAKVAVEFIDDD